MGKVLYLASDNRRHVRTPEGSKKYGLPIGALITRDAELRAEMRFPGRTVPEDSDTGGDSTKGGAPSKPRAAKSPKELAVVVANAPEVTNPELVTPTGDRKINIGGHDFDFPSGTKIYQSRGDDGWGIARKPDYNLTLVTRDGNAVDLAGDTEKTLNERLDDIDPNDIDFVTRDVDAEGTKQADTTDPKAVAQAGAPASAGAPAAPKPGTADVSKAADPTHPYAKFQSHTEVPGHLSDEQISQHIEGLRAAGLDDASLAKVEAQFRGSNDKIKKDWSKATGKDQVAPEELSADNYASVDFDKYSDEELSRASKRMAELQSESIDNGDDDEAIDDKVTEVNKLRRARAAAAKSGKPAPKAKTAEPDKAKTPPTPNEILDSPKPDAATAEPDKAKTPDSPKPDDAVSEKKKDIKVTHQDELKTLEDAATASPTGVAAGEVNGQKVAIRRNRTNGKMEYSVGPDADGFTDVYNDRFDLISDVTKKTPAKKAPNPHTAATRNTSDLPPSDLTDGELDDVLADLTALENQLGRRGAPQELRDRINDLSTEKLSREGDATKSKTDVPAAPKLDDYFADTKAFGDPVQNRNEIQRSKVGDVYAGYGPEGQTEGLWEVQSNGRVRLIEGGDPGKLGSEYSLATFENTIGRTGSRKVDYTLMRSWNGNGGHKDAPEIAKNPGRITADVTNDKSYKFTEADLDNMDVNPGSAAFPYEGDRNDILNAKSGDKFLVHDAQWGDRGLFGMEDDGKLHRLTEGNQNHVTPQTMTTWSDSDPAVTVYPFSGNKSNKNDLPEKRPGDVASSDWAKDAQPGAAAYSGDGVLHDKADDNHWESPLGTVDDTFFDTSDVADTDPVVVRSDPAPDGRPAGATKKLSTAKEFDSVPLGDSVSVAGKSVTAQKKSNGDWHVDFPNGLSMDLANDQFTALVQNHEAWHVPNQDLKGAPSKKSWDVGDKLTSVDDILAQKPGTKLRYDFVNGSTHSTYEVLPDGEIRRENSPNTYPADKIQKAVINGQVSVSEVPEADAPEPKKPVPTPVAKLSDYKVGDQISDYRHLKQMKKGDEVTLTIPASKNGGRSVSVVLTRTDDNMDTGGFMFLVGKRGAGYNSFGENNASLFQAIFDGRLYFGDAMQADDAELAERIDGDWDKTANIELWEGGPMVSEYDLRTFIDAQIYSRAMQGSYYNVDLLPKGSPFKSADLRKKFSALAIDEYSTPGNPARHKPAMIRFASQKLGLEFTDPGSALIPDDLELSDFKTNVSVGRWVRKNGSSKNPAEKNMGPEQLDISKADIKTAMAILDQMIIPNTAKDPDRILKRVMAMRGSPLQDMNTSAAVAAYFGMRRNKNGGLTNHIAKQNDKQNNKELLRQMLREQLEGREPGYYGLPNDEFFSRGSDKFHNYSTLQRPTVNSDNDPNTGVPETRAPEAAAEAVTPSADTLSLWHTPSLGPAYQRVAAMYAQREADAANASDANASDANAPDATVDDPNDFTDANNPSASIPETTTSNVQWSNDRSLAALPDYVKAEGNVNVNGMDYTLRVTEYEGDYAFMGYQNGRDWEVDGHFNSLDEAKAEAEKILADPLVDRPTPDAPNAPESPAAASGNLTSSVLYTDPNGYHGKTGTMTRMESNGPVDYHGTVWFNDDGTGNRAGRASFKYDDGAGAGFAIGPNDTVALDTDVPEANAPEAPAAPAAAPRTLDDFVQAKEGRYFDSPGKAFSAASSAQHKEAWDSDAVFVAIDDASIKLKHVSSDREGFELDQSETEAFSRLAQQINSSKLSAGDKAALAELMDEKNLAGKRMFIDKQGDVIVALDGERIIGPFSLDGRDGHSREEITKKAVRAGGRYAITPDDSTANKLADAGLRATHSLPDGTVVYQYQPETIGSKYDSTQVSPTSSFAQAHQYHDAWLKAYQSSPFHIAFDQGDMGDGHIRDASGKKTKMWGQYGASGLMVRHVGADGVERFFMVQRGKSLSNAMKWQFAGGAINSKEGDEVGGARELFEEVHPPEGWLGNLKGAGSNRFDDPATGWHYANIAVDSPDQFTPKLDYESNDAQWLTRQEIADLEANGELSPPVAASIRKTLSLWGGTEADALPQGKVKKGRTVVDHGSIRDKEAKVGSFSGGSNGGKDYFLPMKDGSTGHYFVKPSKSADAGRQEALASALYREAGLDAPEVDFNETDKHVYSKMIDGVSGNVSNGGIGKAQEGFAADAWLANWDIRLGDNVMFDKDGNPIRLDNGGSLEYRAQGAKKGSGGTTGFGKKVTELDTLRNPNNLGHAIFGSKKGTPDAWEITSAQKVVDIDDATIKGMVKEHHLPDALADTLIARRDDIAAHYNLTATPKPAMDTEQPELPAELIPEAYSADITPADVSAPSVVTRTGSLTTGTPIDDSIKTAGGMAPVAGDWVTLDMSDGSKKDFAVVSPKVPEQGKSISLASNLYKAVGVDTVDSSYDSTEDKVYTGLVKTGVASPTAPDDFKKGFVADAWLANWDAPNQKRFAYDENGNPLRTDLRNSLEYRVSGQKKATFGDSVAELDSMRATGPGLAMYGSRVNGKVDDWEYDGAQQIVDLPDDQIRNMVTDAGLDDALADTLIARRDYIANNYGLRPSNDISIPEPGRFADVEEAGSLSEARKAVGTAKGDYVRANVPEGQSYLDMLKEHGGVDKAFDEMWKGKNPDKPLRPPSGGNLPDRTTATRNDWNPDDDIDAVIDVDLSSSAISSLKAEFPGGNPGGYFNAALRALQRERGYDAPVTEVHADDLDDMVKNREVKLVFRNKGPLGGKSGQQVLADLKADGPDGWWPGNGVYGDGVYVSPSLNTTSGYGPITHSFGMKSDAKYISSSHIRRRSQQIMEQVNKRTDLSPDQLHTLRMIFDENYYHPDRTYDGQGMLGVAATALGYDVISANSGGYGVQSGSWFDQTMPLTPVNQIYNVLNRDALVFDNTKPIPAHGYGANAANTRAAIRQASGLPAHPAPKSARTTGAANPNAAPNGGFAAPSATSSRTTGAANPAAGFATPTGTGPISGRGTGFTTADLDRLSAGQVFYTTGPTGRRTWYRMDANGDIVGYKSGKKVAWINDKKNRLKRFDPFTLIR